MIEKEVVQVWQNLCRNIFINSYHYWCLGQASSVAVQETDPDGQVEPTLQRIQQEQSHKSTEATEVETHSEQEEKPVQVPDLCPI